MAAEVKGKRKIRKKNTRNRSRKRLKGRLPREGKRKRRIKG